MIFYICASLGAFFWACGSLFAYRPTVAWGSYQFNLARISLVALGLAILNLLFNGLDFTPFSLRQFWFFLLSGAAGIFIGDGMLFLVMKRFGPRRTSILFTINAPMTLAAGFLLYGESYSLVALSGAGLVTLGVLTTVLVQNVRNNDQYERVIGNPWLTLLFAFLSAAGQTGGLLALKIAMEEPTSMLQASLWRNVAAASCFWGLRLFYHLFISNKTPLLPPYKPAQKQNYRLMVLNALFGVGIGSYLVVIALSGGQLGLVASLSSTGPLFTLPLLWILNRYPPQFFSWVGAFLAVIGAALIFNG